jgi:hypothetical protein
MRSIKSYVQRSCARRAGPAREPYLAPKVGLEVEATSPRGNAQGQSLLEFAVILIGLLILFLGLIEVALAMRAKLVLTNANREAARLASRGTFTDEQVANQALLALAGQLQADTETNTGIIVTRFRVPAPDASPPASITHQVYITGTFSYTADSGNVDHGIYRRSDPPVCTDGDAHRSTANGGVMSKRGHAAYGRGIAGGVRRIEHVA